MTTATAKNSTLTIYGTTYTLGAGDLIHPEGWGPFAMGSRLRASEWDGADFFLPVYSHGPIRELAVNVTVTGRTTQTLPLNGSGWVRVRIEFVGDGEPSTFSGGWWRPQGL